MALYKNTTSKRINTKPMVFELDVYEKVEPLILLINPATLELKHTTKISEQRVRLTEVSSAYIFQAHHNELDLLSASGKSAMFVSDMGITRVNRSKTHAYENIERLMSIYKNNGTNNNSKSNSSVDPCTIGSIGRVSITYNGFIYKGHFTSFSLTENEATPFNVDFSFEFKVTKTFNSEQFN
jgi:hypothetical protein